MAVNTVQAIINGQTYTLTYNSGSGKYESTITAPSGSSFNQSGGYYNVTIRATDTAGNLTEKDAADATIGASLRLTVKEKVVPTIVITSPGAGARLITGTPSIVFQLRDLDSGVKLADLGLKIDGGTAIGSAGAGMTCNAVANGFDCTYIPQVSLSDGSHTITINVKDNDGNSAVQASVTLIVDTVAPTLNVTAPSAGLITNTASQTVVGVTSDATSSPVTVTVKLNGTDQGAVSVDGGTGNFSKALTLVAGANTIIIRATDSAGKYTEVTRTVTLDLTPPTITAVTLTPNPVDAGATYIISVTVTDV